MELIRSSVVNEEGRRNSSSIKKSRSRRKPGFLKTAEEQYEENCSELHKIYGIFLGASSDP